MMGSSPEKLYVIWPYDGSNPEFFFKLPPFVIDDASVAIYKLEKEIK